MDFCGLGSIQGQIPGQQMDAAILLTVLPGANVLALKAQDVQVSSEPAPLSFPPTSRVLFLSPGYTHAVLQNADS